MHFLLKISELRITRANQLLVFVDFLLQVFADLLHVLHHAETVSFDLLRRRARFIRLQDGVFEFTLCQFELRLQSAHRFFRAVLQFCNRCTKPSDFELRLFQFGARLGKLSLERLDLVEVLRVRLILQLIDLLLEL